MSQLAKSLIPSVLIAPIAAIAPASAAMMTFEHEARLTVPDGGFASFIADVSGINGIVTDVDVEYSVWTTNNIADYDIVLRHPNLTRSLVASDLQFFGGFGQTRFVIDDDAPPLPSSLSNPSGQTFTGRPTDYDFVNDIDPFGEALPLSMFNGQDPNGIWVLVITDDFDTPGQDFTSQFENFRLTITYDPIPAPGAAATLLCASAICLRRRR